MKKKMFMLSVSVVAFAIFICNSADKQNECKYESLLMANVEALSADESYADNIVRVRNRRDEICWVSHYNSSPCPDSTHSSDCKFYTITWSKDHDMYHCINIPVDRYINGPGSWTLCLDQDENCTGQKCQLKPKDNLDGHTTYLLKGKVIDILVSARFVL